MSRSADVKRVLQVSATPLTVREICLQLQYPDAQAKFVSSILATWEKGGKVTAQETVCKVTHRKAKAYVLGAPAGQNQATGGPNQAPPPPRKPRPQPPHEPRLTRDQHQRIEARRRMAENARKAREELFKRALTQDKLERARLLFQKETGCSSRDMAVIQKAYREAAMRLHPDKGGDAVQFANLSAAYAEIKKCHAKA